MPTYSIARPSRLVRESATTMRYCGLRILPIRRSRILTATVFFAPDDYMGEPTEPTWGCGTDVSWTGTRSGLEGASRVPDTSRPFCQTKDRSSQSGPAYAGRSQPAGSGGGVRHPAGGV